MKTRTVNIPTQKLKNIVTPKIPLNTISFLNQDLTQAYLEAMHRFVRFIFGGREFQTDDPENENPENPENSSYIGQCECAVRQFKKNTHIEQALC